MVGEPRLRLHRQPARQHRASGVRQRHHRAQQRMVGRVESGSGRGRGSVGGGQPVPLALEGVGGQVDGAGAGAGEEAGPVDGRAHGVQLRERGEQGVGLLPSLAGRRHQQDCGVLVAVEAGAGHAGEYGVGADLDTAVHARGAQCPDAVAEADGLTDVPHPVVRRGQFTGFRDPARDVRDDGQARLGERQTGQDLAEVSEHRFHQRRVESVRHPQTADPPSLLTERLRHRLDGFLGARDDHRRRTVDGSDRHTFDGLQVRQHLRLARLHGHHRAAFRQRLHQPPTSSHQSTRVRQREHTRHMRGRHLTDRMTGHQVRRDAP